MFAADNLLSHFDDQGRFRNGNCEVGVVFLRKVERSTQGNSDSSVGSS